HRRKAVFIHGTALPAELTYNDKRMRHDVDFGSGTGNGGVCPGLLWSSLWFLQLVFMGWPVAFFVAWIYVLLLPFSACVDVLKSVCEFILKVVQLPLTCAEGMISMKPMF
ncbi:unnamed protein product, partial [Candidula unifasciata]